MIFPKDAFYSLKPQDIQESTTYLHIFYNKMTEPFGILALLAWVLSFYSNKIYQMLTKKFAEGDHTASLMALLALVTLIVGLRLLQSLYWASKDYSRMEFGALDLVTIGAVSFFCSGRIFIWFENQPLYIIAVYATLTLIGLINFLDLGNTRIPADAKHYDMPIEKMIQRFNAVTFGLLLIAFIATGCLLLIGRGLGDGWLCVPLAPAVPLVLLNMIHSHQLSAWPKLLINNRYLAADKIEARMDAVLGIDGGPLERNDQVKNFLLDYRRSFRTVSLRRAQIRDINFIVNLYLENFDYVLEEIFGSDEADRRELMRLMLRNASGLGPLGYLRFYIVYIDQNRSGLLMPEFHVEPKIYAAIGHLSLVWALFKRGESSQILRVYRKAKHLRVFQPKPELKELRISYIAFPKDRQKQGNGSRVIRLIKQAYLESSTNRYTAQTVSAHIRENNAAGVKLFEKAGFSRPERAQDESELSISSKQDRGALIKFTLAADQ